MPNSLPNLLTLSRIVILPALVATFYFDEPAARWTALGLFVAAGITDFFDGYLARSFDIQSKLGQFLDPIADKLLVATAILMLVAFKVIYGPHVLAALIILIREITVSGLREFLADIKVRVPVSRLAKWKTAVQIFALAFLLIGDAAAPFPAVIVGLICLWIAAVLTLYTGYGYLRTGLRHMTGPGEGLEADPAQDGDGVS